jgi:hypothetical protein
MEAEYRPLPPRSRAEEYSVRGCRVPSRALCTEWCSGSTTAIASTPSAAAAAASAAAPLALAPPLAPPPSAPPAAPLASLLSAPSVEERRPGAIAKEPGSTTC